MFGLRNIKCLYLKSIRRIKGFLLSDKSREFLIFLFFYFIASAFWLLQTLNNDYETEFSIPVRLRGVPDNVMLTTEPPALAPARPLAPVESCPPSRRSPVSSATQ